MIDVEYEVFEVKSKKRPDKLHGGSTGQVFSE